MLRPPSRVRAERGSACIAARPRIWALPFGLRASQHMEPGVREEWFPRFALRIPYGGARSLLVQAPEPCLGDTR